MESSGYSFDFNKMIDFILTNDEKNSSSEITEVWMADEEDGDQLSLASKQLREVKEEDASNMQTIRYDLIKTMVGYMAFNELKDMPLVGKMAYNGFIENGFIKKIEE